MLSGIVSRRGPDVDMLTVNRAAGLLTAVLLVSLLVTGAWITWIDPPIPVAVAAFDDIESLTDQQPGTAVWSVHRWLTVPAALATLAWLGTTWSRPVDQPRWSAPVAVTALLIVSGLAMLLAPVGHDEVWSMTIGTNVSGFEPAGGNGPPEIVLADGSTISLSQVRRWLLGHIIAGFLAAVAAVSSLILGSKSLAIPDRAQPDRI